MNPFLAPTGSDLLKNPFIIGLVLIATVFLGYATVLGGYVTVALVIAVPVIFYSFYRVILKPEIGFTFALIINFFILLLLLLLPLELLSYAR